MANIHSFIYFRFNDLLLTQFDNSAAFSADEGITLETVNNNIFSTGRLYLDITTPGKAAIDLGSSLSQTLEISDLEVVGPPGVIGIKGAADSANVPSGRVATINGSNFAAGVVPFVGIAPNDIRWEMHDNSGDGVYESRNRFSYFLDGGPETISVATQEVFYEIGTPTVGAWSDVVSDRWRVESDGSVTYIGEKPITAKVLSTVTVNRASGTAAELEARLAVNWVPGDSGLVESRATTENNAPTSMTLMALIPVVKNDNVRPIFANNTNTANIDVSVTSMIGTE